MEDSPEPNKSSSWSVETSSFLPSSLMSFLLAFKVSALLLSPYMLPCSGCTPGSSACIWPNMVATPSSMRSLTQSQFTGDRLWQAQFLLGQVLTSVPSAGVGESLCHEEQGCQGCGNTSHYLWRSMGKAGTFTTSGTHSLHSVNTWQMTKAMFPISFLYGNQSRFRIVRLWLTETLIFAIYSKDIAFFSAQRLIKAAFI